VSLRGAHLHIDCASGAAGDMMLAALIDLGVPVDAIGEALDRIGAGRGRLAIARVVKHGIAAVDVKVDTSGALEGAGLHHHDGHAHAEHRHEHRHIHVDAQGHVHEHVDADHTHDHAHGHHAHYHYADIRKRIATSDLGGGAKRRALDIFDRLARAEAKLHGKSVDDVAFHEVGAIDSVVDIVGTAAALDWLSPASVTCASVAMGHGTLTCAHGVLPVPAPAALEVLREAGGVMADGGVATELCTPTGAAILAATVTSWTAPPTARARAVGWGAGDTELPDRANVLRVVAMDPAASVALPTGAAPGTTTDRVWQLDANLDDMSPELCGPALDAVFAAGALDAWWTPITMKKGRPALMLSALADEARRDAVAAAILRETTTIGVRYALRDRTVLARRIVEVATRYGAIPVKVAGDNAAPEYEACATAAKQHGVPVKAVFAAALAAYESIRS
jgi:uncharacterized protein (TIGR00299 family) protein